MNDYLRKLGYVYGNRPVEKIAAFVLISYGVVWFGLEHRTFFSVATFTGLMIGVLASCFMRMVSEYVSAENETIVWMIVTIAIWIKYGIKAAGMSIVGWLLFVLIMFILMMPVDLLLRRRK
jgi:hypothetical protein